MDVKQVIVLRTDLKMEKGKLCSQACHASLEAFFKSKQKDSHLAEEWLDSGMPKIILKVNSEKELLDVFTAAKRDVPACLIQDAGRTQIEPGSKTAIGLGPASEKLLDKHTGHLKLL